MHAGHGATLLVEPAFLYLALSITKAMIFALSLSVSDAVKQGFQCNKRIKKNSWGKAYCIISEFGRSKGPALYEPRSPQPPD